MSDQNKLVSILTLLACITFITFVGLAASCEIKGDEIRSKVCLAAIAAQHEAAVSLVCRVPGR